MLAALRFMASAVVVLSKEWQEAILQGWPVCPTYPGGSPKIQLATRARYTITLLSK